MTKHQEHGKKDFSNNSQKLCYICPFYDKDSATHISYLAPFIKKVADKADVFLIIEKANEKPDLGTAYTRVSSKKSKVFKIIKTFFYLIEARAKGYKNIYIHYSFSAAYLASWVFGKTGGKVFYWNCGMPWNYKRPKVRDWFERLAYRRINFLVTGTDGMADLYSKHYKISKEKIKVMANWIDLEKIKNQKSKIKIDDIKKELNIKENQKVLLFVHRLSKRKGAHHLTEIINSLNFKFQISNFILLVAGNGPEAENIKHQITNYKLNDKVRLLGWIPQNKIGDYFSIADVFLMPSEEEGFPHVLLESMVYGVPFVATDVGGVKEITPPILRVYIQKVGNNENFAKAVKELLTLKEDELQKIKDEERGWVKRYDIKVSVERFLEMIE
ncbi:MAG: hypothetical protein COU07_03270 [Candidatus Harrisonbacteria bacterium CG10_big_fil_rev_8_21_14_0_10_40_38]|uniref:Glycosyl transferase family 1 domain-containing protein n=1 Tax=Candidatus Harrisonbacteria bacterium CG10_big_fil_rev_8_21_14_0_10_40_38 TaxID=1974583 RepID=A0A2H0UR80_9BACT|nr:MAG: hypothetical protein COU07_03270 [Candidatus Harrisonbacteria bacterium CG10_big_fil_rev_8_21_14_0_10_40_38]